MALTKDAKWHQLGNFNNILGFGPKSEFWVIFLYLDMSHDRRVNGGIE
jgi:hypothetical protein